MSIQKLLHHIACLKGVTEHFPFDEDTLVFKVGGKNLLFDFLTAMEKTNQVKFKM
jgi:predicted DNA-binding protein (MmcQ/YjbR family)